MGVLGQDGRDEREPAPPNTTLPFRSARALITQIIS